MAVAAFSLVAYINSIFSEDHTVVEPLSVPANCKAGDRIYVEGNQGTPDEQLNPKKKVFYLNIKNPKIPVLFKRILVTLTRKINGGHKLNELSVFGMITRTKRSLFPLSYYIKLGCLSVI